MKKIALGILALNLTACSIAPLTTPNGGTTIGKGEVDISTNLSPAPSATVTFGYKDNTDIGMTVESQIFNTYGFWVKHSFLNQKQGAAAAFIAGAFKSTSSTGSRGFYLGPTLSYTFSDFEFFATGRYNKVYWDGLEILSETEKDDVFFTVDDTEFDYWQADIGFNYSVSDTVKLTLGTSCLYFENDKSCPPIIGASFNVSK